MFGTDMASTKISKWAQLSVQCAEAECNVTNKFVFSKALTTRFALVA